MDWQNEFKAAVAPSNDTQPSLMMAHLSQWSAITIAGDDKKSYLQGQVTCDVVTLPEDQSTFGAHCDAKGKVWSIFRLFHHKGGYAMLQPTSAVSVELTEIKKYAVFSKVEINQTNDVAIGVLGEDAQSYIDSITQASGDVRSFNQGTAVKIDAQRWILLVSEDAVEGLLSQSSRIEKVAESLWSQHEIMSGFPIVEADAQNEHIPQALNLHALGGISFSKGCYTGQETVARAKYRGINKRSMFIVKGKASQLTSPLNLERSVGENWRSAGQLLAHYQYPDNTVIGLIVLPNTLEADTILRLAEDPEHIWTMLPLPYSLDDE